MGGGTDGDASMRYQHTNTSHNRSSGFSSVAEIAGGMGLRSPQPQQLALDFAPAQVRSHGLRDAHIYPQVARRQGASFRVPASQAWGYPSLELRAGNSWPLMGFDCDVPEKVLDALVSNHWGARSDSCPALPEPNMIVQRRSNSHSHVSYFLAKPVHRGPTAREAPLRLFARISEFYRQALGADPGYNGVLTHNPMRSAASPRRVSDALRPQAALFPGRTFRSHTEGLALAGQADHGSGPELRSVRGADEVGGITGEHRARSGDRGAGHE